MTASQPAAPSLDSNAVHTDRFGVIAMKDEILVELFTGDEATDADDVEQMTLSLRREILEIDEVSSVGAVSNGPAPGGTRGLDVAALGALAVSVQPTLEVLRKVFGVLRSRLGQSGSTMRVTVNGHSIELTATKAQQDALVRTFIDQAAGPPAS